MSVCWGLNFGGETAGGSPHSATLVNIRLKDKRYIKDKFAGFNKEVEEIKQKQKNYAIPDAELRNKLQKDNKEFIVPKYAKFYAK